MKIRTKTHGYYSISVTTTGRIIHTNGERAFVISQLQDLLSPRMLIGDLPAYKQLASCIDLLAFSIQDTAVHLVLFSIDKKVATDFAGRIASRLLQYQSEYQSTKFAPANDCRISCKKLSGPHDALSETVKIHLLHDDWEYDRYSSIGFYLHDRRGDWMRIWRLSKLYENDAANYEDLVNNFLSNTKWPRRLQLS